MKEIVQHLGKSIVIVQKLAILMLDIKIKE